MSATVGPHYAPEDPTLPKPWRGLVDGKTGYLYFWNPVTNVTQYQKPVVSSQPDSAPMDKPESVAVSSPKKVQVSSQGLLQNTCVGDNVHTTENDARSEIDSGAINSQILNPVMSATVGPRYALEDPTLPKPWRGLVDGKTGYLYFWNPVTNVTQYPKPVVSSQPDSAPMDKPESVAVSSPKKVQVSSQGLQQNTCVGDNVRTAENDDGSEIDSGAINSQSDRGPDDSINIPNVEVAAVQGGSSGSGYGELAAGSGPSAKSYRLQHEITVTGNNVPPPFTSFAATGLPSEILREIHPAGFSAPSPIQAQSWPIAAQGRDIVAVAKTGSGKTLGYLIPGFMHLKQCRKNPKLGPAVLILSPTRELATQIQEEAAKFGMSSRISCTCLYGGAPKGPQLRDLDRGTDIVVATPGRLNDILEMRRVNLGQISFLVLDEADRMLDMGFEPQIRKIVKEIPTRRQTLMYTATWPREVCKIAADLLVNPVQVNIGNVDELVANKSIVQHVEIVSSMQKQRRVEQILRSQEPGSRIIIFCSTKRMCDQLSRNLSNQFGAAAIHGDKSQDERDSVLSQFRTGRTPILVATDVAARGLDVKDVRVVINYDFPSKFEDYVHRIGRTGRAGATGVAHTFFGDQDARHASDLVKLLEGADQKVPDEIRDMASNGSGFGVQSRRQWGSGPDGNDEGRGGYFSSGFGGRDTGRDGGGHCSDQETHDRFGQGKGGNGWGDKGGRSRSPSPGVGRFDNAPPVRSFHQAMMERARS